MKKNKILILLVFVMSLFVLPNSIKANYTASAVIGEDDMLCDIRLTNKNFYHTYPISGKCFYSDSNLNKVTSGVLFLDTGDQVEVITDQATIPSTDASRCSDYYVYARYGVHYGYFCNANLISNALTDELKEEFRNAGFPESYWEKLAILKKAHPNWTFKAAKTGLNFDDAVNGEMADISRNLMEVTGGYNNVGYLNTASGAYNYYTDTFRVLDGTAWYSANRDSVAYYMDPRNFLIDMYIFQFEALSYDNSFSDESLTKAIESVLAGDYIKKFTQEFISAGKTTNVSPVYLASLAKQEVGVGANPNTAVSGAPFSYNGVSASGVYNFYNIGATGGDANSVYRGLVYAYNMGWTTEALAITGGASFISTDYVSIGQNTSYFKKWDVVSNLNSASGNNYVHQYMQNIQAPTSEAETTYRSYSKNGILNSNFVFYVPVYENMPETTSLSNPGNPNNYLKELTVNGKNIPEFDGGTTEYKFYLDVNTKKISINAKTVNTNATILGLGEYTISENKTISITVKAQNGAERVYKINIILTGTANENTNTNPDNNSTNETSTVKKALNNSGLKNNDTYIYGIAVGSNTNYILEKLKTVDNNVSVVYEKTNNERTIIATGDKVKITIGDETKEYSIVIFGDINGDGKISAVDYAKVKNHVLGNSKLVDAYLKASDVNKDSKVSAVDYAIIKNTVLGVRTIEQ